MILLSWYIQTVPELVQMGPAPLLFATIFSYAIPVVTKYTGRGPQILSVALPISAVLAFAIVSYTQLFLKLSGAALLAGFTWQCVPPRVSRVNDRCNIHGVFI